MYTAAFLFLRENYVFPDVVCRSSVSLNTLEPKLPPLPVREYPGARRNPKMVGIRVPEALNPLVHSSRCVAAIGRTCADNDVELIPLVMIYGTGISQPFSSTGALVPTGVFIP